MAAILVAEIGDVTRFRSAAALCSWAGLNTQTQRVRHARCDAVASPSKDPGSVRWAVIEGTVRYHGGGKLAADYRQIAERRGKNKATMAIARKVLTLVLLRLALRRDPLPRKGRMNGSDTTRRV